MEPAATTPLPPVQQAIQEVRRESAVARWFARIFWLVFSASLHTLLLSTIVAVYLRASRSEERIAFNVFSDKLLTVGDQATVERDLEKLAPEEPVEEPEAPTEEVVTTTETPPEEVGVPDQPEENTAAADPNSPLGIGDGVAAPVSGSGNLGDGLQASDEFGSVISDLRGKGLEIVFLFDSTGSMDSTISEAKRRISFLNDLINLLVPKNRMAIAAYRDRGEPYIVQGENLTKDAGKLKDFLNGVTAGGGGDEPEAVAEAMLWALDQDWSPGAKKVIVLIGDAPGHRGKTYDEAIERCTYFAKKQDGQINVILTIPRKNLESPRYDRVRNFFEEMTTVGDGSTVGFDEPGVLAKRMLLMAFGKQWEKEIDSIYEQAVGKLKNAGDLRNSGQTLDERAARARAVIANPDAAAEALAEAIREIAPVMQSADIPVLMGLTSHADAGVNMAAIRVLSKSPLADTAALADTIVAQLRRALEEKSHMRLFYIQLLGDLRHLNGAPGLIDTLKTCKDDFLTRKARESLELISGESFKTAKRWQEWYDKTVKTAGD